MEFTKLVSKPSFKLDLDKINYKFEAGNKNSNSCKANGNRGKHSLECGNSCGTIYLEDDDSQILEQLKRIEEENIRLREINEQLSRSLCISTRSISINNNNNSFQIDDFSRQSSFLSSQALTTRSISMNPQIVKNLKMTVSDIIGDRSEIALRVMLLEDEYFLGLEPILDRQSARVVLSKTPSYWSIKKIPHFWEGFSNIMSSVIKKGFLNTISYWSFLRAPPSPKKNVKKWEGITIKYKGPLKEFRGYSLAGNDDGLFVYLESEEDAYDNIFYCNFRKKKEKCTEDFRDCTNDLRTNVLNLLHANTRSFICIEPNIKSKGGNIMIKLSESKKNKLMFEEISASELLARQLLISAEQISQDFDLTNRNIHQMTSFPSFRNYEQNFQKTSSNRYSPEESFRSRTVELCSPVETQNKDKRGSLADELSNELLTQRNQLLSNFFGETNHSKYTLSDSIGFKKEIPHNNSSKIIDTNLGENSKICSPRIRASNVINDQLSGLEYHEVPLTRRLNVVYIPSTTAVLVHDLVDSEEELNNNIDSGKISDVEQEYFKVE
ncbi:unnamed protein product [Cryptosporidium hominis]|uniref:Uncharacterized protein n=1 Tax=Cryptosporidium hominis TaxID=237895 RepID=A0A0S4TFA9_CRYHO|nr:hypothetical protein ChTU502y2012_401g0520 [Cryptosporidium hominis]PPA65229.1 hypothetical protein ChUKH1_16085 [Cryptosporidium hominis]CUV05110.1 unnamed protein product [Cryptosporidium hominis]